MDPFHDLDPEDVIALQEALIILPQVTKGKHKISGAFLAPLSPNPSSSSSPCANFTACVRFRDVAPFEIPEEIESAASVEWCGFSPDAATVLFTRWTNRPDGADNPDDIIDYMRADVLSADPRKELSPSDAMRRMGLSTTFQEAILDSKHETESITCWALERVTRRWEILLGVMRELKDVATSCRARERAKLGFKL